jgi:hypothetical protein
VANETRPLIPRRTETTLMFQNEHTCCICRERNKDVVIHHINRNKADNRLRNLAVVCMDCHSRVTGTRGLGKRFSASEVRAYKGDWEALIAKKHSLNLVPRRELTRRQNDLMEFDITRNVSELAATRDPKRARQILEILDVYAIFGADSRFILDQLDLIVPLLGGTQKASLVAEYATHYLGYLLGFDRKLRHKDVQIIEKAISILEWSGEWNAQWGDAATVNKCLASLHYVFGIAKEYDLQRFRRKIVRAIKKIDKKALSTEGVFEERKPIHTRADFYLRKIEPGSP